MAGIAAPDADPLALDEGGERRFGTQITEIEGRDGHITRSTAAR